MASLDASLRASHTDQADVAPSGAQFRPPERVSESQATTTIDDESSTPTRHSFGAVLGQRQLPNEAAHPDRMESSPRKGHEASKRDSSHFATHTNRDVQDVEMGDRDDDGGEEDDGSDNESIDGDSERPSKKKKGQRFFCTEFPPCQLSFTRSEHLARHIRKHTGERPFQCHCSRRFSRLDNLRQHAQTVHVNEEIPGDSLAATSTRFQRQIRTDRVRPPGSRSRASTIGSQSGYVRGHSRNLSTSSVGSTTSSLGGQEDVRRRPQPLAMANDPTLRARMSTDSYNATSTPPQQYAYYNQSSSGYSTPTSTTFSTGGQSPQYHGSVMASPASTLGRSSFYNGARSANRRLSVPSANIPFQNQTPYSQPYFNPLPSGQSSTFSQNSSVYGSPTSSVFSHGRHESESDMEWRRRTWHPSTNSQYAQRPATSGLTYHQTPDEPRPAFTQHQAASQMTRLPGIESFDHAPPSNVRQQSSPMMIDNRPMSSGRPTDSFLQQGLTRLDITAANAPVEGQWQAIQAPPPGYQYPPPPQTAQYIQQKHFSMPENPVTPRRHKRNAWYGGPITPVAGVQMVNRPSPEDSGSSDGVPTPSTSLGAEYNPVIVNPPGTAEPYQQPGAVVVDENKVARADSGYHSYNPPAQGQGQPQQTYALQPRQEPQYPPPNFPQQPNSGMAKLEALVAVATSEGSRAADRHS